MDTLVIIKNIGTRTLAFTGVPRLLPGETTEVKKSVADRLVLGSPDVEIVIPEAPKDTIRPEEKEEPSKKKNRL